MPQRPRCHGNGSSSCTSASCAFYDPCQPSVSFAKPRLLRVCVLSTMRREVPSQLSALRFLLAGCQDHPIADLASLQGQHVFIFLFIFAQRI